MNVKMNANPTRLNSTLLLVGCGKMGGALLRGWLAEGLDGTQVAIVQPSRSVADEFSAHGVTVVASAADLPKGFAPQFVVLAVRPNQLAEACAPLKEVESAQSAGIISIVAGVSVARLAEFFPQASSVIRAMPNLPVEIQRGITTLFADPDTKANSKSEVESLFATLGKTLWLSKEEQILLTTALAGSGPAYVFLLVQAMAEAGQALGLSAEEAGLLARATVSGSGGLLDHRPEDAAELVAEVAVAGGVTEAALQSGLQQDLPQAMITALEAGLARAKALG